MAIVRSKNSKMKDRVIILPIVGKIQYNDKCEFEVKNLEEAKELVGIEELDLELVLKPLSAKEKAEEEKRKEEERIAKEKAEAEEEKKKGTQLSKEEKIEYINTLNSMSELKELVGGFPEQEWSSIKSKAKLKEYLITKIENA